MARQVIINGVDYNSLVESVDFNSGLGEGSSCQIYTIQGMPEIPAFSTIQVKMDGSTVFNGYVGAPREIWDGNPPSLFSAQYECYDNGTGFNQYVVSGTFIGTASEVASQIIEAVRKEYSGFSYTFACQGTLSGVNVNLTFDYSYLYDAFNALADVYGGYWFVTPANKIYFFTTSMADVDKDPITINYSNVQTPYQHDKATDAIINEVIVIGGEGESIQTETWKYSPTNNIHHMAYPALSVNATWGGDPAYLIAEGFSGDPYKESDKDYAESYQSTSGNDRTSAAITGIVVHHIAASSATKEDLRSWHVDNNGWNDIGYHWYIRKSGAIIACRPELQIGAHTINHNSYTIGIACEGDFERVDTKMSTTQFNALISCIQSVMGRYGGIKKNAIYFHGDLRATACPGKYFPKSAVLSAVQTGTTTGISLGDNTTTTPSTNSAKRLYFNASEQYLKAVPTYEPPIGTVITIEYTTSYTVSERYQDKASIQAVGRRITQVIADATILDKATARGQAVAILNRYKNIDERVVFKLVDYQQVYAGDKVYLPWLNKYGLVNNVQGRLWCSNFEDNEIQLEVKLL